MIGVKSLRRFRGLNNVLDPMRGSATGLDKHESWEWQSVADNVDGTDSEGLQRREGYASFLVATNITASFSTFDYSRMYIIDSGVLKEVNRDGTTRALQSGFSTSPAYWAELNGDTYLSCGTRTVRISSDGRVDAWGIPTPTSLAATSGSGRLISGTYQVALTYTDATGREGGASPATEVTITTEGGVSVQIPQIAGYTANLYCTEADGTVFYLWGSPTTNAVTITTNPTGPELTTQFLDEPPTGQYIAIFGANLYVAEYMETTDQTVVWFSQPMGYHLFNLNMDYFIVPGQVTQLFGSGEVLLVATHNRIFLYNNDKLEQVAEYGAVPGQHCDLGPDGKLYFWTKRGLCRAAPFENLTDTRVSVAPGVYAGGGVIEKGGYRKYVAVIHQGGSAHNRR